MGIKGMCFNIFMDIGEDKVDSDLIVAEIIL